MRGWEPSIWTRLRWVLIALTIGLVIFLVTLGIKDADASAGRFDCWRASAVGKIESELGTDMALGRVIGKWCDYGFVMTSNDPVRAKRIITSSGEVFFWSGKLVRKGKKCIDRVAQIFCKGYVWTAKFRFKQDWPDPFPDNIEHMRVRLRCMAAHARKPERACTGRSKVWS